MVFIKNRVSKPLFRFIAFVTTCILFHALLAVSGGVPPINASTATTALSAISTILTNVEAIRNASVQGQNTPTTVSANTAFFGGAPTRLGATPPNQINSVPNSAQTSDTGSLGRLGNTSGNSFMEAAEAVMAIGSSALSASQLVGTADVAAHSRGQSEDADNPLLKMAMGFATCDPSKNGICCAAPSFCVPGATCSSDISPSNIFEIVRAVPKCTCPWGFYGDGRTKGSGCININECESGEAGCEHLCEDKAPGFICTCRKGYTLLSDGKRCEDIDECAAGISGCSGTCRNTIGGFECGCENGYKLGDDGQTCEDIDECTSNNTCDYRCHNTPGSFLCSCPEGFFLDPSTKVRCIDRNECVEGLYPDGRSACATDGSQICTNTAGSFHCSCAKGFRQTLPNSKQSPNHSPIISYGIKDFPSSRRLEFSFLLDSSGLKTPATLFNSSNRLNHLDKWGLLKSDPPAVSVVSEGQSSAGLLLSGQESASNNVSAEGIFGTLQLENPNNETSPPGKNTDAVESMQIATPTDYSWLSCTDINECDVLNYPSGKSPCPSSQRCINTFGDFQCTCDDGFKATSSGSCADIDECVVGIRVHRKAETLTRRACEHFCSNSIGGYTCSCRPGYRLSGDGKCVDVDECADSNNGGCAHFCQNLPGSHRCECKPGFRSIGRSCLDIDECDNSMTHKCSDLCINTPGSYLCGCSKGSEKLASDGRTCLSKNDCRLNSGSCNRGFVCQEGINGIHECVCPPNFYLSTSNNEKVCKDVDECTRGFPNEGDNPCPSISRPCCVNTSGSFECVAKQRARALVSFTKSCISPSVDTTSLP